MFKYNHFSYRTINNFKKLLFLIVAFLLQGCSVIGSKSFSSSNIYLIASVISVSLFLLYKKYIIKKNKWFILLLLCIILVNIGYLLLSVSKTLSFALLANNISYFGSVFLLFSMFMTILTKTHLKYNRHLPIALLVICVIIFIIVSSPGYSDIYYKEVSLSFINGSTVLNKTYGPLHSIYLYYLLSYLFAMTCVIIHAHKTGKLESLLELVILLLAVFINIFIWLIEQLVNFNFEFLSISYIISVMFLLSLDFIIQDNKVRITKIKDEMSDYKNSLKPTQTNISHETEIITEEQIHLFKVGIAHLTPTEKQIFNLYIEGKSTKDILDILNIKENTLKYHNKNIYGKLCVKSRKQLIEIYKHL